MTNHARLSFAEALSATQQWWMDAGVDLIFEDAPQAWLDGSPEEEAIPAEPQMPAAIPQIEVQPRMPGLGGEPADWPRDLESFIAWWRSDHSFDSGGIGPRIGPRGPANPRLMILVAEPEPDDEDTLLSGPQGRLLENMLRAMGIAAQDVYLASALPRRTPMADWASLADAGLREITLHHIGLVSPERLLVLGRNILPLTSNDPTKNSAILPEVNHEGANPVIFAGWDLATLLARAKARSTFWRGWLKWTEGKA